MVKKSYLMSNLQNCFACAVAMGVGWIVSCDSVIFASTSHFPSKLCTKRDQARHGSDCGSTANASHQIKRVIGSYLNVGLQGDAVVVMIEDVGGELVGD